MRSTGGNARPGSPEPTITGATTTCSRSRQPAARKCDTVRAPPSTSTRRRPRADKASKIAPGSRRGLDPGRAIVSMSFEIRNRVPSRVITMRRVPSAAKTRALVPRVPRGRSRRVPDSGPDATYGEFRVIGAHRAGANDDCIDDGSQAMQMIKSRWPVYVVRMAGKRGDASIDRLSDLADDNSSRARSCPQWTEQALPWLRQHVPGANSMRDFGPRRPGVDG